MTLRTETPPQADAHAPARAARDAFAHSMQATALVSTVLAIAAAIVCPKFLRRAPAEPAPATPA